MDLLGYAGRGLVPFEQLMQVVSTTSDYDRSHGQRPKMVNSASVIHMENHHLSCGIVSRLGKHTRNITKA